MRLIGMREPRSENSWMHNAPLLMRGDRSQHARMHVDDAAAANIVDGDSGADRLAARRDRAAGHRDQGHRRRASSRSRTGGATRAPAAGRWPTRAGGANVNQLMSSAPEDLEKLAGMARLTGVPVRVTSSAPLGER